MDYFFNELIQSRNERVVSDKNQLFIVLKKGVRTSLSCLRNQLRVESAVR